MPTQLKEDVCVGPGCGRMCRQELSRTPRWASLVRPSRCPVSCDLPAARLSDSADGCEPGHCLRLPPATVAFVSQSWRNFLQFCCCCSYPNQPSSSFPVGAKSHRRIQNSYLADGRGSGAGICSRSAALFSSIPSTRFPSSNLSSKT